jgi:hypothetical protein
MGEETLSVAARVSAREHLVAPGRAIRGMFRVGSKQFYPDEGPANEARVAPFAIEIEYR